MVKIVQVRIFPSCTISTLYYQTISDINIGSYKQYIYN